MSVSYWYFSSQNTHLLPNMMKENISSQSILYIPILFISVGGSHSSVAREKKSEEEEISWLIFSHRAPSGAGESLGKMCS